jgi:hypothetical protein
MQFVTGGPEPLAPEFQTRFTVALKELLEKKHLYQSNPHFGTLDADTDHSPS